LVEGLIKSLDEPDKKLDEIWAEEAEKNPIFRSALKVAVASLAPVAIS